MAFFATQDSDTPTLRQALKSDNAAHWIKALESEVRSLEAIGTWSRVERSTLPSNTKVMKNTWALRVKRLPSGEFLKFKARLCVRGDLQVHGENFWETYSPVVSWPLIRILFVLSAMYGLCSRHIDFTNAFAQSFLQEEIYMELPQGFDADKSKYVLKLRRSLYGLKQSAMNWFNTLSSALRAYGLDQSQLDPCLFYGKRLIVVIYVDDCLLFSSLLKPINHLINTLSKTFPLTDEGDITAYLGIEVSRPDKNTFHLKQPSSINKLLSLVGLDDSSKACLTPAIVNPPPPKTGTVATYTWSYATAIGILIWIAFNTRPELAFATSQAAKYTADPKQEHFRLVVRIARYLLGTRDKGMIISPELTSPTFDVFVDASFAGDFVAANPDISWDSSLLRSRCGHVICFAGVPLLWVSKLATEIALSTTEAEYIALSNSLRDVEPVRHVLLQVNKSLGLDIPIPTLHCTVFEDNNGAIQLATTPKLRPRTRHIGVKYHHALDKIRQGLISIKKIDTELQRADIFTKALPVDSFTRLRKFLLGW